MTGAGGGRSDRAAGYESARQDVLALIPLTVRNVLEIGCSAGALGAALRARQPSVVLGIELDAHYAAEASSRLNRVVMSDADAFATGEPPPEAPFDCLICADVLEHLVDPWTTLDRLVAFLSPGATVVVSLPNVLWHVALLRLLRRRVWPREDQGVFDRTHLRWFSLDDGSALLTDSGLAVTQVDFRYWDARRSRLRIYSLLSRTPLRAFLAAQHIYVAVKPGAGH